MRFLILGLNIFILVATLFGLPAVSQDIEVFSSEHYINNASVHLHKIIGHDQDHFYVIRYYGNQYFLEKLDKDMKPLVEQPIKLFKGIKTFQLETVVHFYNELYVFVSRARLNEIVLYYQRINKEDLRPSTDLIELTTVKNIRGSWADFHFALSRHEKKLLIACRTKLLWSGAQYNEFYVYGENFDLVWKRKDSYEYKGQGPRDNLYIVDETGNVSILSLLKRASIFSLLREVKNLYTIYRYTNFGGDFKEYPVTLTDRYIRGIRIIGGTQGELICAGLYSDIFKTGVRGTFFFKIDPETGIKYDEYLNEFDSALLSRLADMKEPMLKDEELINYVITDMVLRDNGKIIIIAEQLFNQSFDTYNNLIITCYDTNGQVYWTQLIEKNQDFNTSSISNKDLELADYREYIMETGILNQSAENYCSYALMAPLDKTWIVLFYNDDVRNIDQPEKIRNFNRPKKSYLLAVMIDEYGSITRKPLVTWKKKALFPEPIRYYDTLLETVVIPAYRYRKFNYLKITARLN
jgi:hypothetical protein